MIDFGANYINQTRKRNGKGLLIQRIGVSFGFNLLLIFIVL